MTLPEFKAWFDPELDRVITQQLTTYYQLTPDASLRHYLAHIKHLLLDGGKRSRPYVAWLSYQSFGGTNTDRIKAVLLAVEVFHLFCLVHDDITDKGLTRHDTPTEHVYIRTYLTEQSRAGDVEHISDNQAMLVGDLLFVLAQELLERAELDSTTQRHVHRVVHAMANQVIVGQMLDLDLTTRDLVDEETILTKGRLKTAGYSFVSPLKIGAVLAGALDQQNEWCESVGYAIGSAFQIQDDILDITGLTHNQEKKTAGNDLRDGQHTFLTHYIQKHGSAEEKSELARYFRQPFRESDFPHIVTLFTPAIEAARTEVTRDISFARTQIESASFAPVLKQRWLDLIALLENRA